MRSTNGFKHVRMANMENTKTNNVPSHPFSQRETSTWTRKDNRQLMRYNNYINFTNGE